MKTCIFIKFLVRCKRLPLHSMQNYASQYSKDRVADWHVGRTRDYRAPMLAGFLRTQLRHVVGKHRNAIDQPTSVELLTNVDTAVDKQYRMATSKR